jgi:hypothetical protein
VYSGTEPAVDLKLLSAVEADSVFEVPLFTIPKGAVPVYDEQLHAVVGYRHETSTGVFRLYDLEGNFIAMEELGLESPLLDPIDIIVLFGGLLRGIEKGVGTIAARAVSRGSVAIGGRTLSTAVTGAMRTAFRRLSLRSLKFTATTAAHMAEPGRHVPVHILHLAIKYGRRAPDPRRAQGAFLYTIKMLRNGKERALEIVVRENDWTILHTNRLLAKCRAQVSLFSCSRERRTATP